MEKRSLGRGFEDISNFFLSSSKSTETQNIEQDIIAPEKKPSEETVESTCEIEENITVRKNIAFLNTPKAQEHILNTLSKHIKDNYHIKSIELRKKSKKAQPGKKNSIEEKITLYIK